MSAEQMALPLRAGVTLRTSRCAGPGCHNVLQGQRSTKRFCSPKCRVARHRRAGPSNDWHSPSEVVEAARRVLGGIDLDPASSAKADEIVRASAFYTVRDDGLRQPWFGRVWLNPPYGNQAPKFVEKFSAEYRSGHVRAACLLLAVHHMTSKWFAALYDFAPLVCLPDRRLHFSGSKVRPAHGSVILGIGVGRQLFEDAFRSFGRVFAA